MIKAKIIVEVSYQYKEEIARIESKLESGGYLIKSHDTLLNKITAEAYQELPYDEV